MKNPDAAEKLAAIATLISLYETQRADEPDEGWPEGDLSPRQVLMAIIDILDGKS